MINMLPGLTPLAGPTTGERLPVLQTSLGPTTVRQLPSASVICDDSLNSIGPLTRSGLKNEYYSDLGLTAVSPCNTLLGSVLIAINVPIASRIIATSRCNSSTFSANDIS